MNMFANTPGWASVAVAESMQKPYQCKACPDCQCATGQEQVAAGGPSGGCGQCYEVRTTGKNPYGSDVPIMTFHAAVVDSCPHDANQEWCPENVGDKNRHGFEFHIDVFQPDHDKLNIGDNPFVQLRPVDCPAEIVEVMQSKCCDVWYPGQGCNAICPQDTCPGTPSPPPPTPTPTPPSPEPSPTPSPSGCPGGSLDACIAMCPAAIFQACCESCAARCPSAVQI